MYSARYRRGEISEETLNWAKTHACPSCGACSFDVRPAACFYYAGGVPAIMEEIKEYLHMDAMTVTGKTLGENLEQLRQNGFYERCDKWLQEFNKRYCCSVTHGSDLK